MVPSILSDEGKSDTSIGEATRMLTFYNGLAGSHLAPDKYAWLLPAFFAAAAQFPEGFQVWRNGGPPATAAAEGSAREGCSRAMCKGGDAR
eukprot:2742853-Rhodomonas_salina.1